MTSASALKRNCGYPRFLDKNAPPPRTQRDRDALLRKTAAAEKGTLFHAAIEAWAKNPGPPPEVSDPEVNGHLEMLAMSWAPTPWMRFELAVGLRANGTGVLCDEPEPHVYTSRDGSEIVTAGRADVVWADSYHGTHVAYVRDWKTGRWSVTPATRNLQTSALALAVCSLAGAEGFVREIYYTRDGYLDADEAPVMVGSPEYAQALADVLAAAAMDDSPRPGDHCGECWESRTKRCTKAQR